MSMTSTKNLPLTAAGMALGLGDMLRNQVDETLDENLKKRKAGNTMGALNPNSAGISAAVASLLGTQQVAG